MLKKRRKLAELDYILSSTYLLPFLIYLLGPLNSHDFEFLSTSRARTLVAANFALWRRPEHAVLCFGLNVSKLKLFNKVSSIMSV